MYAMLFRFSERTQFRLGSR